MYPTRIIGQLPAPAILAKLNAHKSGAGAMVMLYLDVVQERLHEAELADQKKRIKAHRRQKFWAGVAEGLSGPAMLFTYIAAPKVEPLPQPTDELAMRAAWWRTGHIMRAAIQVVMDKHKLSAADLGLTRRERYDLAAYTSPHHHGTPLLQTVRMQMLDARHAASPAAKVA